MKTASICPFQLNRLTGTPIRARAATEAIHAFATQEVITTADNFLIFTYKTVRKLISIRPDVIHGFSTLSVLPILIYKMAHPKTKFIFEMHGWSWFETSGTLWWPKRMALLMLDTIGYLLATRVIAMSHTQRDFLITKLGQPDKVRVIWGPVDFPIEFEPPQENEPLLVGYQGNSSWWQGLDILLAATKQLEDRNDIRFQLAGFDYSDEIQFPRASNITYVGKFERKDVSNLIRRCDVMVSPRLAHKVSDLQYPQKLSEYLAAGRPVIAFNTSDQQMIINEAQAGFIVEKETCEDLVHSIEEFANLSTEKQTELGKNAAAFAQENFSMSVFGNKLKEIYAELSKL